MKQTHVQLFTKGATTCEINDILVHYLVNDGVIYLKTKDEEGNRWDYIFPLWNVEQVRFSSYNDKED